MTSPVYIVADHGGHKLKLYLLKSLGQFNNWHDMSPHNQAGDDYPTRVATLIRALRKNSLARGIAICRTGVGMCIVANKFSGIRAVTAVTADVAKKSRTDEDTNVLCLGADTITQRQAKKIVETWLRTLFIPLPRYQRRLNEIKRYETGI